MLAVRYGPLNMGQKYGEDLQYNCQELSSTFHLTLLLLLLLIVPFVVTFRHECGSASVYGAAVGLKLKQRVRGCPDVLSLRNISREVPTKSWAQRIGISKTLDSESLDF